MMLFFAAPPSTEPQGFRLHTAYRMFLAAPESENVVALLADLTAIALDNIAHGRVRGRWWHPLGPERSMVNGGDMTLPGDAVYVGVGVSTLDSVDGSWQQLARTLRSPSGTGSVRSAFDLKSECYALLVDGTAIKVDRDPHARVGSSGVRSSKPLEARWDRHWHNPHHDLTAQGDADTRQVWHHLDTLHEVLTAHLHRKRSQ
ncbi:hypothetical protein D0Q02_30570 [Micromonospora craniellae]|uniref:Uncharacterized protein n=1 Tax=Micromonospora craniellae TaxID=2294034 RepID=A0A372FR27_9ACTN|nr:hypothetical protein ID554_12520 [Micromonospora craniellae]RFS40479.1 hypothetical protein D0Q02_30570 [Micromonospora craniellae]